MFDNWKITAGYLGSFGFASVSLSSIMDCSLTVFSILGALFGCIGALLTMLMQYRRFRRDLKNSDKQITSNQSGDAPGKNDEGCN